MKIINQIKLNNQLEEVKILNEKDNLRSDLGLTSFDLAELTVRIEDEFDIDIFEDGIVNTIEEIYLKLNV